MLPVDKKNSNKCLFILKCIPRIHKPTTQLHHLKVNKSNNRYSDMKNNLRNSKHLKQQPAIY